MKEPDLSSGALTGATGELTTHDPDRPFVPAERREMVDPEHQADVTMVQGQSAPAQSDEIGQPGEAATERGPTELADRESGYGSEEGLSPRDPVYRMEVRPRGEDTDAPNPGTRIGGDEVTDQPDHF